tara:strand:+ start:239 stop:433 length:195 start_codon:yes stop_codon:yes gene_type:complete
MKNLNERIKNLSAQSIAILLNFNPNDTSFASNKEIRKMLNEQVVAKFENDEIDEIELLIIEQGE